MAEETIVAAILAFSFGMIIQRMIHQIVAARKVLLREKRREILEEKKNRHE
ncbi:MAG: hypothetical protein RR368_08310 [Oscillospiraceae bacterium]